MSRIELDGVEMTDFLETQRTGVLCLGRENDGYGVPLSFNYREDDSSIYFRMGYAPGSQKRRFLEAAENVTFVVYDQTDEGWISVVAEGTLESVSEGDVESVVEEATRHLDIPYYEVHERPVDDLEFEVLRLRVSKLNGVREGHEGQ
ncbi:pyridoxamine 5'-phosphate oxidase family protein [Halomicroarcula sp. F13]|uniref:Pyridoxamine 5'-phosphate oxidase family protein n=1 Tax=Haloarcula rubra TaxID=2487747 RepID=A0AAW4PTU6_9EURY|nr:pyridoxamine 5'-phosphate oxidase family protein [Halomicroarcula rubra]MBX0324559.1 pyridoxamine 5'-phosphate oxidase family protein [Halomicroarcula rubra]